MSSFQSSPGQKAGCNFWLWVQSGLSRCFNPHPAFWPGATRDRAGPSAPTAMFQSSPGQKAGCNHPHRRHLQPVRSRFNPPRPEGRVQHRPSVRWAGTARACFNPHPAFWPGATAKQSASSARRSRRFNPHPARRPGATSPQLLGAGCSQCFNPHPAFWPGATLVKCIQPSIYLFQFQSSPGLLAGCNGILQWTQKLSISMFQSSPGQKAGCNRDMLKVMSSSVLFQSSPGLLAGCNLAGLGDTLYANEFQSSPGQKAGCNSRSSLGAGRVAPGVSILTRPEGRVQPLEAGPKSPGCGERFRQ